MFLDLSQEKDRVKFQAYSEKLLNSSSYIEITKKDPRSKNQNRYLHLLFVWFGIETGYGADYVKQKFFKYEANKEIFVVEVNGKLGKVRELRSSADLTSSEMTKAIENFRNWSAAVVGVYLPGANEHEFLRHIEKESEKYV